MTTLHQKHQILESLNSMDHVQTEKVLAYVKGLLRPTPHETAYDRFKRNAMKEISEALSKK